MSNAQTSVEQAGQAIAKGGPAPVFEIRPASGWLNLSLRELWAYRDLLYILIWRDIKVRYKQTAIGAAWAILQPVLAMVVFTLFFGVLIKVPSDGVPFTPPGVHRKHRSLASMKLCFVRTLSGLRVEAVKRQAYAAGNVVASDQ